MQRCALLQLPAVRCAHADLRREYRTVEAAWQNGDHPRWTMAGRLNRLIAMERRLGLNRPAETGTLEMHFPGAWPACLETKHDLIYEQCAEHKDCGMTVTHTGGNLRRQFIFDGPWNDPPPLG